MGYVRRTGGEAAVDRVLAEAGETRPRSVLEDERSWSTFDQKIALFEAAARVLGDPDVGVHVGEHVLAEQIGLPLRMVLWAGGSPAQLLRNIAKAGVKFSTVADMACLEAGVDSAIVTYHLQPGYRPNRHDCGYTRGLLSQATALFGLPPATVRHDDCQVDGAERCVYVLSWPRRRRLLGRRSRTHRLETELRLMTEQVESLQRAAADIVAAADVATTIEQIARSARRIVRAPGHMLAVRPLAGGVPVVIAEGIGDEQRAPLMDCLLGDAGPGVAGEDDGHGRLVVDVASPRRTYGRLAAVHPGGDPFFGEERQMLAAFAQMAATALDAAVSRETMTALSSLAAELANARGQDAVCQTVADALPRVVGAPVAAVAKWHAGQESLCFVGVRGFPPELERALRALPVRPSDTPEVLEQLVQPEPRLFHRRTRDPFIRGLLQAFGVEGAMAVPILLRGSLLGHVVAGWTSDPPAELDAELVDRMASVAAQAATALENAQLLERTTHQALHDPLTGLPNRVLLDDRLGQAGAAARRDGCSVGVLLVDLDGFKLVNDTLGHRAGDEVLRVVSSRLAGVLREADTAARVGGDEFVLVCQGLSDPDEVRAIAARVEQVVREPITVAGAAVVVGASVGHTVVGDAITDVDALLASADEAMYAVKRGRVDRAPQLASARNVRR